MENHSLIFFKIIYFLYLCIYIKIYKFFWCRNEAAKEETDTEDSGTQSALNDSSPEKKKKVNENLVIVTINYRIYVNLMHNLVLKI